MTRRDRQLRVRLSDDEALHLDAVCASRPGQSRSDVVRDLIVEAVERLVDEGPPAVETVDLDELHELLSAQARDGNVTAMRELARLLKARRSGDADEDAAAGPTPDSFDALDGGTTVVDLDAKRRGRRGADA